MDKWDEVSVSADFEQCCQEIAAGEYVTYTDIALLFPDNLRLDGVLKEARP